ncbi:phage baseplate assembly protein V [Microvirga pakistanensis]|uniref:phage baseplate assembly protein V n=1 Tax=Microvirga pakistanensis TaxID=1682650 RepID=UPI00106A65E2|nr:phage baseplate assembly protein V [Microvirga pakistanensis]
MLQSAFAAQSAIESAIELGEVVAVDDPEGLSRVEVRFLSRGPVADDKTNDAQEDSTAWALVAVPVAGDRHGAFLIPDVGSRVVLGFVNGDHRYPVVLGSIWDGSVSIPDSLGGSGKAVDRWSFKGKAGTRIAMVEENGSSKIELRTAHGNKIVIDDGGSSITLSGGGNTITMDGRGIKLDSHTVEISAVQFKVSAALGSFDVALADFSAFVMCELMQTNTVISTTYTPGAGNIW